MTLVCGAPSQDVRISSFFSIFEHFDKRFRRNILSSQ